jgi:Ca2+-binding EF-hand superfamily protein
MGYRSACMGVALLLCMTSATAAEKSDADGPGDTRARVLTRMDRNGDGKISFEEYRNAMLRRFAARDKNNDGVLDGSEFPREWLAGAAEEAAQQRVTLEDFGAELETTFKRFDSNGDGELEGAELDAFVSARRAKEEAKP